MLFSSTGTMAFAAPETNSVDFRNHEAANDDLPSSFPSHVFPSSCPPHQEFQGISPLLMRRAMSFDHNQESRVEDDMSDDDGSSHLLGEKKRRLNLEQVKALERSFEMGNKLEPERKMQLARALGLKPRQIAIWFQNRRARCKTKQLEKDYEILKRQCDKLKADNDALKTQNKKLHSELQLLSLGNRESAGGTPPMLFNLEIFRLLYHCLNHSASPEHKLRTGSCNIYNFIKIKHLPGCRLPWMDLHEVYHNKCQHGIHENVHVNLKAQTGREIFSNQNDVKLEGLITDL